jgi:hypothetical protein
MANIDYRTQIKSFLEADGNSKTFYNVVLRDQGKDFCDATYSPATGVISADNTKKVPCITISDALFWEYMNVATTHKVLDVQPIKGLIRHQIDNTDTVGIIQQIYQTRKKAETDDITIEAGAQDFYALVGTPNGAAAAYILGDYSKAIGKTTIGSILLIDGRTHSIIFKYA